MFIFEPVRWIDAFGWRPTCENERLGGYEIIELVGVGGMGEVYRGRDARLNRVVALKHRHADRTQRASSRSVGRLPVLRMPTRYTLPAIHATAAMPRTSSPSDAAISTTRHHHERYDGRGYPDGLRVEAIPHEVRLLSIVDAYDALTSHRAYRPAPLSHEAAIATPRCESAGGKWDPAMVEQFATMLGASAPAWEQITLPAPVLKLA